MESRSILLKISELNSVYGLAARMYFDDLTKCEQFLLECYKEILSEGKSLEEHFGKDLIEEIIRFNNGKT